MPNIIELADKQGPQKKFSAGRNVTIAVAEVIIFPGVRYEHLDADSCSDPAQIRR